MSDAEKASKAAPRRASVVDAFIAKDRVAVFWFLAAVILAGVCAWFVNVLGKEIATRPPFVVMDAAGDYYVGAGLPYNLADEMHRDLTALAVDTILTRGPTGIKNAYRLERLCDRKGLAAVNADLDKESQLFREQQITQTYTLDPAPEKAIVLGSRNFPRNISTAARGTVRRNMIVAGKPQTEVFAFTLSFVWSIDSDPVYSKSYPSKISRFTATFEQIKE